MWTRIVAADALGAMESNLMVPGRSGFRLSPDSELSEADSGASSLGDPPLGDPIYGIGCITGAASARGKLVRERLVGIGRHEHSQS